MSTGKTHEVNTYETRPDKVRALQIVLGTTTRTTIREFCPDANVGVRVVKGVGDEKDIRWVHLMNGSGQSGEMSEDGDWIVELPNVGFRILRHHEFVSRFRATAPPSPTSLRVKSCVNEVWCVAPRGFHVNSCPMAMTT